MSKITSGMKAQRAPRFVLGYIGLLLTLITAFSIMFLAIPEGASATWQTIIIMLVLGFVLSTPTLFKHFKYSDISPARANGEMYFGFITFMGVGLTSAVVGMLNGYIFKAQDTFQGILTILASPVPEEFIFAGGLFGLMLYAAKGRYRFWIANTTPAIIFAFYHYYVYGYTIPTMFVLFMGRTILDYGYYYTGDLSVPIIGHEFVNIIALIGAFLR